MLKVELYKDSPEEWDTFVLGHKDSTFFHQIGWKNVVEKTYGHKPFYLVVKENGSIKGILPLFLMKHILFGKFLVSVPFGDYAGICADDEETSNILLKEAIKISDSNGAKFLELRNIESMNNGSLMTKTTRATLILKLEEDPQKLWKSLKPKVRNQVRKAEKSGIKAEIGDKSLVRDFYNVYAHNMRDLGTPVHSLSFFENILNIFPENSNVIIVRLDGKAIGAAVATYFRDTMEIPWSSSLRDFFALCPNNLLYWTALEYACSKGYKLFNFGRSPWESGTFQFKKQWGAEPVQLHYQYYVNNGDEMPDYTPSTSSRFDMAIWLWRKLPVSITKLIGPRIIAGIPY